MRERRWREKKKNCEGTRGGKEEEHAREAIVRGSTYSSLRR
jgi:hypothetical protein